MINSIYDSDITPNFCYKIINYTGDDDIRLEYNTSSISFLIEKVVHICFLGLSNYLIGKPGRNIDDIFEMLHILYLKPNIIFHVEIRSHLIRIYKYIMKCNRRDLIYYLHYVVGNDLTYLQSEMKDANDDPIRDANCMRAKSLYQTDPNVIRNMNMNMIAQYVKKEIIDDEDFT